MPSFKRTLKDEKKSGKLMKKSDYSFDLRNFLVENKLTETGRTEEGKRYHFKKTFLSEMIMPAEDGSLEYNPSFSNNKGANRAMHRENYRYTKTGTYSSSSFDEIMSVIEDLEKEINR